jgi:starch-binding outer membrane protein, SusD/RagB family
MKNKLIQLLFLSVLFFFSACTDMDLNPLSEGSSENWYSKENQIVMSLNDLYRIDFWPNYQIPYQDYDLWSDDVMYRDRTTAFTNGTLNGQDGTVNSWWTNSYKCIARANTILMNLEKGKVQLPQAKIDLYAGEARFVRASQYAKLITYWGDVVYYTGILNINKSFNLSKTDKNIILKAIYDDFDFAAQKLPATYGSQSTRATKGAAMAMKARVALFFGEWAVARDAAKACMDLGVYELYPDYATLFLSKTKDPKELIFGNARSSKLNVTITDTKNYLTRLVGGWGGATGPSWYLFCSYLCTDGLPIDESPLFDPRNPFKNRDPRCTSTIVEFGTPWLGFMYQPHPDSLKVMNFKTGQLVTNNDNRANAPFASYNGLAFKKGIDEDWTDDYKAENTNLIMRYADVLLMYAEAKTELGEINQEMLDASVNKVRARAYKVNVTDKDKYPAVTSTDQATVRKAVRIERRMEFALEGRRYEDLLRWKLAEKAINNDMYGMLDPADLRAKVVEPGLWFFPEVPPIDEDGIASFEPMYNAGLVKLNAVRTFPAHQYLWPIPTKEIMINSNLSQNTGY